MSTFTYLLHFKKLCEKIYSKEYHFMEQSLCELKAKEAKMGFNPSAVKTANI